MSHAGRIKELPDPTSVTFPRKDSAQRLRGQYADSGIAPLTCFMLKAPGTHAVSLSLECDYLAKQRQDHAPLSPSSPDGVSLAIMVMSLSESPGVLRNVA